MDLYSDMDLSLFGGDLLVGLVPTSAELDKATQDVRKSTDLIGSWATTIDLDVSSEQDELSLSSSTINTSGKNSSQTHSQWVYKVYM